MAVKLPIWVRNTNLMKDALYYTVGESGASVDKACGVVIGVVSTLMANGMNFSQAMDVLRENLPDNYRDECIPEPWRFAVLEK